MSSRRCSTVLRTVSSSLPRSAQPLNLRAFHDLAPRRFPSISSSSSPRNHLQQYQQDRLASTSTSTPTSTTASSSSPTSAPSPPQASSSTFPKPKYSSYFYSFLSGILVAYAIDVWRQNTSNNTSNAGQEGKEAKILSLPTAKADEKKDQSDGTLPPHAALDETPIHLDPDTSIPFPSSIKPLGTSSSQELKLIGLGVRTVSFLRVKVYSAGAYFDPSALTSLRNNEAKGEALIADILNQRHDIAIRIVPTRNTDHSHLRDGFVRAMLGRMKQATSTKQLSDSQAEKAGKDLDSFKGFFPTGKVSKGNNMLVTRRGTDGALLLEYEGKLLGTLENPFLSKQLILAYFADNDKEISPKLKSDVLAGLERYL